MTLEISHSFPPEIILEILLKASVKSLLRLKSVCKEWYSLISDQHFIKSHYTLSSNKNINYVHHRLVYNIFEHLNNLYSCPLYDVLFHKSVNNALLLENPLQRTPPPHALRIVGSCNGLVCLFVDNYDVDYDLFIYNPSTRIGNASPFPRRYSRPDQYSFGYDESTDDYKIVELTETYFGTYHYIIKGQIYSSKTRKWKSLCDFSREYPLNGSGIFLKGALHWVAYGVSPRTQRIVSLDLANETYGEVLQFEYDEGATKFITLGFWGECLCGLCFSYESHADLWVMKVYGVKDSWTKLASFPYLTHPWIGLYPRLFYISDEGKVLLYYASKLVIYNLKDSSSPKKIEYADKICEGCIVVESLVSPLGKL